MGKRMVIESPSGQRIELDEETTARLEELAAKEGVTPHEWLVNRANTELAIFQARKPLIDKYADERTKQLIAKVTGKK